jgi:hypothetical protein
MSLCKVCLFYNNRAQTCVRSVVAVSPGKVHHDYAKMVRLDKKRCGPEGKWFVGVDGLAQKSPVEELFESFDN